jgi:hypothetical protein
MHVGGRPEPTTLTDREKEICAAIGPELKKRGMIFVGIDVIGGYLTEINVTSPTGLQEIARFDGVHLERAIWDAIEAKRRRLEAEGRVHHQQAAAVQPARVGRLAQPQLGGHHVAHPVARSASWKARTGARCFTGYQAARTAGAEAAVQRDDRGGQAANSSSCSKGGSISTRPRFSGKGVSARIASQASRRCTATWRSRAKWARSAAWSSGCSSQQASRSPSRSAARTSAGEPG